MTGYKDFNYPAFDLAAEVLRAFGFTVFNPTECFQGNTTLPKEVYMKEELKAVLEASVVIVLRGWERSAGAQLEVEVAKACGIPYYEYDEFLDKMEENLKRFIVDLESNDV